MTTPLDTRSPAAALDDERRWQAVEEQDAAFDGAFVLAVRTTGIYCRPTCPARTPKRENVRFLASPDEAERAGFRACRRCRPNKDPQNGEQIGTSFPLGSTLLPKLRRGPSVRSRTKARATPSL